MDQTLISNMILLIILLLSLISRNTTLGIAVVFLILVNLVGGLGEGLDEGSKYILDKADQYGLKIGIIILMIGILAPVANGKIKLEDIKNIGMTTEGIIGIVVGIGVAVLAGRGGTLLEMDPKMTTALVFGTVLGVVLFKGYPIGPLVGSGIAAVILHVIRLFKVK